MVQELVTAEDNIDYIWQKPSGIAAAFNLGVNSANSEWLWFLNGGDEVHPEADTGLLINLLGKARSDVIIFDIEMMQSGNKTSHPPLWALWPPLFWVPHPSTLLRRCLFDKYGRFNQEYDIAMDGELWIRFFSKEIVIDMLSMPLSLYGQNGVSNTDISKVDREANRIIVNNFRSLFEIWARGGLYLFKAIKKHFLSGGS
jgi:hypothetical protein